MIADGAFIPAALSKYKTLMSQFIKGEISASSFQSSYLTMFQNEEPLGNQEVFDVLQYLFTSADGYVADPETRSAILAENPKLRKYGQGLDDEELLADARDAYRQLFGG
jgi:hypothetical protein